MTRVKRGTTKLKTRRSVLSKMKGGRFGIGSKERASREAIKHAALHSFAHRKDRKNDFRRLWTVRLNASLREHGISYSVFINTLKKKGVALNRKMLSELAKDHGESFSRLVKEVK